MITPFVNDLTDGGVIVKGEGRAVEIVSKLFKPEEEIVEREIKRKLTKTPEEFAAQDHQEDKGQALSLSGYKIKKALLDKLGRQYAGFYQCPGCLKRRDDLQLFRVKKNGDRPSIADYTLLCGSCREQRAEKRKKKKKANRKWRRRYVKGDGSSKTSFFNSIRKSVFERDGHKCLLCEILGKKKYEEGSGLTPGLGLAPLIAESKGGERCVDNYVVSCAVHRAAKGNKLPLEYIFEKVSLDCWMSEQLSDEPMVEHPAARVKINMHLVAEISQYLYKIAAGVEIDRSKAERLAIKLSETDEDRKKEREQFLW